MNIKELIEEAKENRTVNDLMNMLEEYDIEFKNLEICNDANVEIELTDFDGCSLLIHIWPTDEVIADEELLDEFFDECENENWDYVDDNIAGMYLLAWKVDDIDNIICNYKDFGYTEEQANALSLR